MLIRLVYLFMVRVFGWQTRTVPVLGITAYPLGASQAGSRREGSEASSSLARVMG